jgi:hypothetical protein
MFNKILKFLTPFLSLIVVLLAAEICLRLNQDFDLVYPYQDYFYGKRMMVSTTKGEPWRKKEYENLIIRDRNLQHVKKLPDLEKSQNIVFLLGDSITESSSMPVNESFYQVLDSRRDDLDIVGFHFAGCSLMALGIELNNYAQHLNQNGKVFKPDYAIMQIRELSYIGGNTSFFDPRIGQMVDYQEKIKAEELSPVVALKKQLLNFFTINPKFSNRWIDNRFREWVVGDYHFISLVLWRFFQWTQQTNRFYPNNEQLILDSSLEDQYWRRFENSVALVKQISQANQIPVGILLVPEPDWFKRYERTRSYNQKEKKYQEIFAKHNIPFEYSIEEIYSIYQQSNQNVFWEDRHPSKTGSQGISIALENLLKRMMQ